MKNFLPNKCQGYIVKYKEGWGGGGEVWENFSMEQFSKYITYKTQTPENSTNSDTLPGWVEVNIYTWSKYSFYRCLTEEQNMIIIFP